jgi:hypothetical protein
VRRVAARAAAATSVAAAAALLAPAAAQAHALVGRKDLPIPAWLFAWGASIVLIVSFFILSFAWHKVRFEEDDWHPVSEGLSRAIINPVTAWLAGALGVFLLGVSVWSGLYGVGTPDLNFSLTFLFVTAWIGFALVSVALGDVFRAFNPWRAIARAARAVLRLLTGQEPRAPLTYPERLGRWPGAAGVVIFVWIELISGASGFQAVGVQPRTAAIAALVYTGYTLGAMALFGIEKWLDRGEAFSVYFGMFSRLSAVEVRGGRLGVRRFLSGTTSWAMVPGSLAIVLVTIGGTTFDGAQEGVLASPISSIGHRFIDWGFGGSLALRLDETFWLAVTLAFVALIYWLGIRGMHLVKGSPPTRELGRRFAHTMIPIGLAYVTAHYFSLFFFQEQAQFTYLLSDPLGNGSNYFGTVTSSIDYSLLSPTVVWYVQVGALVVGHVTGLVLAHDRAIATYGDSKTASLSQRWMLMVMVGFTCLGLFLLSQSNA